MARSGNALRSGRVREVRGRSSEERKREREDMQNLLCQCWKSQHKYSCTEYISIHTCTIIIYLHVYAHDDVLL